MIDRDKEGDGGRWAWWHAVLIVCITVVVFLAVIVAALIVVSLCMYKKIVHVGACVP